MQVPIGAESVLTSARILDTVDAEGGGIGSPPWVGVVLRARARGRLSGHAALEQDDVAPHPVQLPDPLADAYPAEAAAFVQRQ